MTQIDKFSILFSALQQITATFSKESQALQKAFDEECEAQFKMAFPRKKWSRTRNEEIPGWTALIGEWKARADHLYASYMTNKADLERLLAEESTSASIPVVDDKKTQIGWVYDGAYRSQGWGQKKYMRADANLIAAKATIYGLTTTMEEDDTGITVYANTTEIGAEILKRKPDVPLEETMKMLYRDGANPKVLFPFLPWEIVDKYWHA